MMKSETVMNAHAQPTAAEYEHAMKIVEDFINEAYGILKRTPSISCSFDKATSVKEAIGCIAEYIDCELPQTAAILREIREGLFEKTSIGLIINRDMFGMLFAVGRTIEGQLPLVIWPNIHPDITKASRYYFYQGNYGSAVDVAFKELECKLRAISRANKDGLEPKDIQSVIGNVFSETSGLDTGGMDTHSGHDYRRGLRDSLKASFMAYRNPGAHTNLSRTKEEAAELIVLCSHFMFVLDGARRLYG